MPFNIYPWHTSRHQYRLLPLSSKFSPEKFLPGWPRGRAPLLTGLGLQLPSFALLAQGGQESVPRLSSRPSVSVSQPAARIFLRVCRC